MGVKLREAGVITDFDLVVLASEVVCWLLGHAFGAGIDADAGRNPHGLAIDEHVEVGMGVGHEELLLGRLESGLPRHESRGLRVCPLARSSPA